ncbi:MAG: methyltransferase domain-containing protein [Solirubrobacteraceae bacterium]|nr:methyltransferase domain-containing protein [Solirubrobacteraceae bacterium]
MTPAAGPRAAQAPQTGSERVLALLRDDVGLEPHEDRWLEVAGLGDPAPPSTVSQHLMRTRVVPAIYERWWRPALGQIAKGPRGPSMGGERRMARLLLGASAGDRVLDLGCGPGPFTRDLARAVGPEGLAVGLDASPTMLSRATERPPLPEQLVYVRGDARKLPFADGAFDGVCCFALLHLVDRPWRVLVEAARVIRPGGRIALFAGCSPAGGLLGDGGRLLMKPVGLRTFGRNELTGWLDDHGFADIDQRIAGVTQFVGATRSGDGG